MSQLPATSFTPGQTELQQLDQVDEWVIVKIIPKINTNETLAEVRPLPRPKQLSRWN